MYKFILVQLCSHYFFYDDPNNYRIGMNIEKKHSNNLMLLQLCIQMCLYCSLVLTAHCSFLHLLMAYH